MGQELSEEQLKQALGGYMHLTPGQVEVFAELLSTLPPWQTEFLTTLLDERAADKSRLTLLETMLGYYKNMGDKVEGKHPEAGEVVLPGGYQVSSYTDEPGKFLVFKVVKGEQMVVAEHLSSEASAINVAYELDRNDDPYRWRPMSETCPTGMFLLFACSDWAHSVELNKPVPVKTGYRGEEGIRIFGASWRPTHWCYQPEAPLCSAAPESKAR